MREYVTADTVANTIRMKRSLHKGAFLVVEGVTDKHVYRLVLDDEICSIETANGRDNAVGAIRILNEGSFSGVLAIIDADFTHITGEQTGEANILQTDFHDLECMIINSPALDRMLDEFGSDDKVRSFEKTTALIARQLASNVIPLGCLRFISIQQGLNLKFEGLKFSRFTQQDVLQVDVLEMVRIVLNHSNNHDLNQMDLAGKVEDVMEKGHDCWQISCGHDVVALLSFAFQRTLGSKNSGEVSRELLQRSLRLAYDASYFKETNLYRAMEDWERNNPEYPILDRGSH